ncbi:hypothetical protein AOXY_G38543 [Acipenser oxyrinchus oxyrinchus]|uniref:Uncharacterized protein n=1 Tax=Acipenser oxyrinchus oxyrinchus TaxID=40147 RepID=A0AAD8CFX7_ACIOX|nr:hypothetical protein AOXY_G38543 [Acipenser oxyrinchus oxyrinchus]
MKDSSLCAAGGQFPQRRIPAGARCLLLTSSCCYCYFISLSSLLFYKQGFELGSRDSIQYRICANSQCPCAG